MNLAVRLAHADESAALESIIRACGRDMEARWSLRHWAGPYPFDLVRQDARAGRLYAVERDGRVIGTFSVNLVPDDYIDLTMYREPEAPAAYLHRLAVLPVHQGGGVGSWCVTQVERIAREHGARYLRLETYAPNVAATRLYLRLGYEHRGGLVLHTGIPELPRVELECLEKHLATDAA